MTLLLLTMTSLISTVVNIIQSLIIFIFFNGKKGTRFVWSQINLSQWQGCLTLPLQSQDKKKNDVLMKCLKLKNYFLISDNFTNCDTQYTVECRWPFTSILMNCLRSFHDDKSLMKCFCQTRLCIVGVSNRSGKHFLFWSFIESLWFNLLKLFLNTESAAVFIRFGV